MRVKENIKKRSSDPATSFILPLESLQIIMKKIVCIVWLENQWTCEMGNQLTGIAPSQIQPVDQYLTDIPDYQYENRSEDFISLLQFNHLCQPRVFGGAEWTKNSWPAKMQFNLTTRYTKIVCIFIMGIKINFFWNIMITTTICMV